MPAHRTPPLSVTEIVTAATSMTAEISLDELSMRSVAAELGVTPMALYHHVGDRKALQSLVADAVVAAIPVPASDLAWPLWFAAFQESLEKHLPVHRGVARYLLEHPSTPAGAAVRSRTVEVLVGQGFDEPTALLAASTFHTHLLGRLAVTVVAGEQRADEPAWRQFGLSASDYAQFGLDVLIAGIQAQATSQQKRRHQSAH